MTQQVSFTTSHPIPHQFHAYIQSHVWDHGQVLGCSIWSFTKKTWRATWCCTFNACNDARVHLSSTARICLLGLQAPHIQMVPVVDVAYDTTMVFDSNLELWPYISSREHHLPKAQIADLDDTKIQYTSKKHSFVSLLWFGLCLVLVRVGFVGIGTSDVYVWLRDPCSNFNKVNSIKNWSTQTKPDYCWSHSIWFDIYISSLFSYLFFLFFLFLFLFFIFIFLKSDLFLCFCFVLIFGTC